MLLKCFATKLSINSPAQRQARGLAWFECRQRRYATRAYVHRVGDKPLVYRNFGEQLQRALDKYGQRPAVIACEENERHTFAEATQQAEQLVYALRQLGLQRGEHLGVWAPNTVQWYVTFLASTLGGYPLVCLNPAWQASELQFALRKAHVKVLVTMDRHGKQDFLQILRGVLPEAQGGQDTFESARLPELRAVLIKTRDECEFIQYDSVFSKKEVSRKEHEALHRDALTISAEALCSILFTSGTTGMPKAAVLTHFNCVNESVYFGQSLRLHEDHKSVCLNVPLFHIFALSIGMGALEYGTTMVLPSATFSGTAALNAIEKERCTVVVGTPTMYVDMLEQQQKASRDLSSLQLGLVGGSPCPPEIFIKAQTQLGIQDMRIGYGMTESSAAVFAHDGSEAAPAMLTTVGRLYPHMEAKVINGKGETLAFGEPGELCLRGYFTMRGYLDDEAKTKEAFTVDGWLRTGDEFILEADGTGRVVGRKKDVIIRGGENIYPKEIEDFLQTHPDILEAQITGVPDKRLGEEICAWLRLNAAAQPVSVDDLRLFCKGNLAHYKMPRYVRIVDVFPKTISGKIQKFKLQEMF